MTELFCAILIQTQNTCTRKCWFCKFGQQRKDEAITQMDWETIRRSLEPQGSALPREDILVQHQ
jgi:2-iminoacetate synthase ThiH